MRFGNTPRDATELACAGGHSHLSCSFSILIPFRIVHLPICLLFERLSETKTATVRRLDITLHYYAHDSFITRAYRVLFTNHHNATISPACALDTTLLLRTYTYTHSPVHPAQPFDKDAYFYSLAGYCRQSV